MFATVCLTGCGRDAKPVIADPSVASSDESADASLRVIQHQTECCYSEGQISFVQLTSTDGVVVVDRAFAGLGSAVAVFDVDLRPGRYQLRSWQRPCSASCPPDPRSQRLDPVSDECAADVDVGDGRYERTIRFAPGKGCTIVADAIAVDVPDAVTLRREVRGCGTDFIGVPGGSTTAGLCLLDAHEQGTPAEARSYESSDDPQRPRFFIRMTTEDGVVVFERPDPDGKVWTRTRCDDLERVADADIIVATGCGSPEQLELPS